jgi:ABC-type Na+ efflux pump permease subunit
MKLARRSGVRGVWPVLQRELRETARRPANHWLRVGSGAAGIFMVYGTSRLFGQYMTPSAIGTQIFLALHRMLLLLIFCVVPIMSADCIAREKREGTLGLLFLTGLTPAGIVVGKSLVQGLRAFTMWVAVLPALAIPFLSGGVTWVQTIAAVRLEFCTAVYCLSAGLLASTLARKRAMAIALSLLLASLLLWVFAGMSAFGLLPRPAAVMGYTTGNYATGGRYYFSGQVITYSNSLNARYYAMAVGRPWWKVGITSLRESAFSVLLVVCMFIFVLRIAARRIDESWQDKPPSVKRENFFKRYSTPLFREWLVGRMRRSLDRNPIAWLQQYSWKARAIKWGLCLAFVSFECMMVRGNLDRVEEAQIILVVILAAVFTFSGVNSFLDEKRTGALELMLTTPISPNQIIYGRVWGLWKQFLPAGLIIAGFYFAAAAQVRQMGWYYRDPDSPLLPMWFVLNGFLALPVFATYFALRVKNLIVGGVLTWLALFLAPAMGIGLLNEILWHLGAELSVRMVLVGALMGNGAFALLTCFLLRHSLSRRIYAF